MYDLHIHSNHSDGTDSWQTILQKAQEASLSRISITDHDNCDVYFQMENPEEYFTGEIITGIEMQAYFMGLSIEILGYGFDIGKMREHLQGLYLPFEKISRIELERLHERCVANGVTLPSNVLENYDNKKFYYSTQYFHNEIKKFPANRSLIPDNESWEHYYVFFKRHISNPSSPFYIDESDIIPAAEKVIEIIRKAGGKVVLPHVYQYEENTYLVLDGLLDSLDGIECYYPTFTVEQSAYLLDLCKKKDLLVTGGSDYHGESRPNRIGEIM